jgi:hypothetical protein
MGKIIHLNNLILNINSYHDDDYIFVLADEYSFEVLDFETFSSLSNSSLYMDFNFSINDLKKFLQLYSFFNNQINHDDLLKSLLFYLKEKQYDFCNTLPFIKLINIFNLFNSRDTIYMKEPWEINSPYSIYRIDRDFDNNLPQPIYSYFIECFVAEQFLQCKINFPNNSDTDFIQMLIDYAINDS